MLNIIKADLFRISKDKLWLAVIIVVLIVFTIPSVYTLSGMGGLSMYDQGVYLDEYVESRLPDYGVEYAYELTTAQYREIVFSIDGYMTDINIIGGAYIPLFEMIIILEVLLVTRDFSIHSIKNTLSSPVNRKTYFFAKYVTLLMMSFVMVIAVNLSVWIANIIINGSVRSLPFGLLILYTLLSLIPLTAFVSLVHAAAFIIRKSLPFCLATICTSLFASNLFVSLSFLLGGGDTKFVRLITYFLSSIYSGITCTDDEEFVQYLLTSIIICVILTAGSLAGGYLFFRKREIK